MKILAGTIYVLVVMLIILSQIIDFRTGMMLNVTQQQYAVILLLAGAGLLGFMFITGRGFRDKPKPSRYDH